MILEFNAWARRHMAALELRTDKVIITFEVCLDSWYFLFGITYYASVPSFHLEFLCFSLNIEGR